MSARPQRKRKEPKYLKENAADERELEIEMSKKMRRNKLKEGEEDDFDYSTIPSAPIVEKETKTRGKKAAQKEDSDDEEADEEEEKKAKEKVMRKKRGVRKEEE